MAASEIRRFTRKDLADQHGKTILWCTHNLKEAEEICDRLAIIHKGKIIAGGALEDMQQLMEEGNFYHLEIDHWPENALQELGDLPVRTFHNNGYTNLEIRAMQEDIPVVIERLMARGIKVYTCTRKQPDLETIFERLISYERKE